MIALQSGSNGNAVYVEAEGVRLLFDAGISGAAAAERLAALGRDIRQVDALLISHDHADHVRAAGVYQRKFGLPLHATARTLQVAAARKSLGRLQQVFHFRPGEVLRFGKVAVETIPTPHDGVEGVAFVVDDGRHRLGILTDLGHVFAGLADVVASLDGMLLESNYDPQMLHQGSYPEFLKRRIAGPGGHISNFEAAELLARAIDRRARWVCLGHLSEENNRPELVLRTHRQLLDGRVPLCVASRYGASAMLEL
jgi:phosphoribosyl 1,2-cyclic phosphodiesterase